MRSLLVVILLFAAGCGGVKDLAFLGDEFQLSPGEDRTIAGEDFTISFISVKNDSRCPSGVQCVWEGNAEVHIRMAKTGHPESEAVLNTSSQFSREARYLEYSIRLISLQPHPTAGSAIAQADYSARFIVTK